MNMQFDYREVLVKSFSNCGLNYGKNPVKLSAVTVYEAVLSIMGFRNLCYMALAKIRA